MLASKNLPFSMIRKILCCAIFGLALGSIAFAAVPGPAQQRKVIALVTFCESIAHDDTEAPRRGTESENAAAHPKDSPPDSDVLARRLKMSTSDFDALLDLMAAEHAAGKFECPNDRIAGTR